MILSGTGLRRFAGALLIAMLAVACPASAQHGDPAPVESANWADDAVDFIRAAYALPDQEQSARRVRFEARVEKLEPLQQLEYWKEFVFQSALLSDVTGHEFGMTALGALARDHGLDTSPEFRAITSIALETLQSGDYSEGADRLDTILESGRLATDDRIRALIARATALYWTYRTIEAAELVNAAKQLAEVKGVNRLVAFDITSAEAFVFFKMDDPRPVLDALQREFWMMQELDLPYPIGVGPYNVALLLSIHKQPKQALEASDLLLASSRRPLYDNHRFDALYFCGGLNYGLGNYRRAMECFREAGDHLPAEEARAAARLKVYVKSAIGAGDAVVARREFANLASYPTFSASENERLDVAQMEVDLLQLEGRFKEALEKQRLQSAAMAEHLSVESAKLTDTQLQYLKDESVRISERANLLQTQNDLQRHRILLLRGVVLLLALLFILTGLYVVLMRRKQREVVAARDEARRMNDVKSRFLANMSHEVRTPMNSVMGLADALSRTRLDTHQSSMVTLIRRSGALLTRVLDDILDLSRIEADAIAIEARSFAPFALMADLPQLFDTLETGGPVTLETETDFPPETTVVADDGRIRQVLNNLVSNALKFTDRGAVDVRAWLTPEDEAFKTMRLHFSVKDTGVGIPADKLDQVFAAFEQGDATSNRKYGGLGLGLSICKQLVERMGGEITVESVPGAGSTFCFSVPVTLDGAAPVSFAPVAPDLDNLPAGIGQTRVLVAEDHPMNRRVIKMLLAELGIEPVIADDGRIALETYAGAHFDLVLLDIQMPELDGTSTLEKMRLIDAEEGRRSPHYVAFTANAMPQHIEEYLRCGFDRVLTKPIEISDLYGVLRGLEAA